MYMYMYTYIYRAPGETGCSSEWSGILQSFLMVLGAVALLSLSTFDFLKRL